MAEPIVHPRRLAIAMLVACALSTALIAWVVQPAEAAKGIPGQSVLVVRSAGDHDALWLLSPADGTPTAAGELPGRAGAVAVSPGGLSVAYLPANGSPRVWIGFGPLGPKTVSLASAGVRRADSLTWIDDHRLLVSGATKAKASYTQDGLYVVNVTTGKAASFRGLRGVEPYGVPARGRVVYTKLTVVKPGTAANQHSPTVRESLRSVRLSGGTGRTVLSQTYTLWADHRSFTHPKLSSDGKWLISGTTGSDVSVTYTVREGDGLPLFTVFTAALDVTAGWDASGRAAFGGTPHWGMDQSCVWVSEPGKGTLACTPDGLLPSVMVTDLAWSADGTLVAGAVDWNTRPRTRRVYVLPGDLATATDLGRGRLPVWAQP